MFIEIGSHQRLFGSLLVAVVALSTSALPSRASVQTATPTPAIGHMVCSAHMAEQNKLFIAWGFTAAGNRYEEVGQAFATMLRSRGYAGVSAYAPAGSQPPALTVDCRWHATEAQAADFKNSLVAGAQRNRMTFVPVSFDPAQL